MDHWRSDRARSVTIADHPLAGIHQAEFDYRGANQAAIAPVLKSEQHTSELPSLMRTSSVTFCSKKKIIRMLANKYQKKKNHKNMNLENMTMIQKRDHVK